MTAPRPRRRPRAWLFLPIFALLANCKPEPHPWDQGDAATPQAPPPRQESSAELRVLTAPPGATLEPPAGSGEPPAEVEDAGPPVRVGGPWVRCYGNFKLSGDPVKDLTRLALLCGPENGMVRLDDKRLEGAVREGGPAVSTTFQAERGACYRVFAVGEPSVVDLDVTVRSSRGAPLAADHGEDAWPIVQPDRPFCALEDDRYTVEVSAHKGAGRFAAETWILHTPPGKGKGAPRGRSVPGAD